MTTTADVPTRFDVGIQGRGYMIDWAMKDRLSGPTSLQVARNQTDTQNKAGEQSLARQNLWRRTITSWHHGMGQLVYDDETSDPYRYYKGVGIDVWTPGRVKPLGSVSRLPIPAANGGHIAGTNNQMLTYTGLPYVVGLAGGTSLYYAYDPSAAVTTPAQILSVCTDGKTIYLACAGGGTLGGGLIYSIASGSGASVAYTAATSFYLVRYALGRLWGASDTGLYNITGGAAFSLAANKSATAVWTDVVAAQGGVIASVVDGNDSTLHFVGLLPDGTGITGGYPIADLPRGEQVKAMHSYLGYIILGTNKGVRVCKHSGGSNFTVGPLLDLFTDVGQTSSPGSLNAPEATAVRCFASTGRWVYFGWSFFYWGGSVSGTGKSGQFYAGLGRLDLSTFIDNLQPAYATDVMRFIDNNDDHSSGEVTGCAVDKWGTPSFVVSADEFYGGSLSGTPNRSTLGAPLNLNNFLYQGRIIHGVNDYKLVSRARLRHDRADASNTITVGFQDEGGFSALNGGPVTSPVSSQVTSVDTFSAAILPSVQPNITWSSSGILASLALHDIQIEAWPSPPRLERWQLPLLVHKTVGTKDEGSHTYDSLTTLLNEVRSYSSPAGRVVIDFQFLGQTYSAVVDDYEFIPYGPAPVVGDEYQGTLVVTLSRAVG